MHLKRFAATGEKIHRLVTIEATLCLASQQFELLSVVCHMGSELRGHYYTLVREQDDLWVQLEDATIRRSLTNENVQELMRSYAYLCTYQAVDQQQKQPKQLPNTTMLE